jgi:signal transduction histidine kinase
MSGTTIALQATPTKGRKIYGYPGPLIHVFAWTLIGLLAYARHLLLCGPNEQTISWPELLMWMSCFGPAAIFGTLIFHCEKLFPLGGHRWLRNTVALAAIGVAFSYVACQIAAAGCFGVEHLFSLPITSPHPTWAVAKNEFAIQFFLFWSVVGAGCVFRYFLHLQSREREKTELLLEKSRLEASLKQAELQALRMRLNPHFLFNTLQNISVLTQQDPGTASQMLTRLGDLLRTAIRSGSEQESDLATEIGLTEAYASLEKMRFAERLQVVFEVEPETTHARVPTLLLQPLLENAIKHGLRGMSREGIVAIRASKESSRLVLRVTDNGIGPPAEKLVKRGPVMGAGIGLGATSERLEHLYPGENEVTMSRTAEGGTEVRIVLPFRPLPPKMERHDRHDEAALAHR